MAKRFAALLYSTKLQLMLFMVIERFKHGDAERVGERFSGAGRMLPDEVAYQASWMEATGARCFQIVEAPTAASLKDWIAAWQDLIDFEVVPVQPSGEFWDNWSAVSDSE